MVRYSFLLIILIGFSAISTARANVCDPEWWKTATVPELEALHANEQAFPNSCNQWKDTPLHFGVSHSQNAEVVAAFIDMTEVDITAPNASEKTPIDLAQERLDTARLLARYARETYNNAIRDATNANRSASLRHLRREMSQIAVEARRERNQAENEEEVAEAIYQIFSDSQ